MFNREHEGTGGGSYNQPRHHDYNYGEEGAAAIGEEDDEGMYDNSNDNNNILRAGGSGMLN